jgi:hypothetical protein
VEAEHRVAAPPEPQRLQRDDFFGCDVAQVHVTTELLDEPRLLFLAGRLEEQASRVDCFADFPDEARLDLALRVVPADRTRFPALGDDLPGAGVELALDLPQRLGG